jgi:hypothetical protein
MRRSRNVERCIMLQKFEERRQEPRHGLARVAQIQLGTGAAPLYCVVTDISDGACTYMPTVSMSRMNLCCFSPAMVLLKMADTE